MRIKYNMNQPSLVPFSDLNGGEVFAYAGSEFMKIAQRHNHACCVATAVCLSDGLLAEVHENAQCTRLNGLFVASRDNNKSCIVQCTRDEPCTVHHCVYDDCYCPER